MPHEIKDRDGKVLRYSKNLAGIRRYVPERGTPAISSLHVSRKGRHRDEGLLSIYFANGNTYEAKFASFVVLCGFVRRWRSVYGVPLVLDGIYTGYVSSQNPNPA